jgi:hypothetical protein
MASAETATGFLRIAHRDLRTALEMTDASLFDEATWGFHGQQAIEKALIEFKQIIGRGTRLREGQLSLQ